MIARAAPTAWRSRRRSSRRGHTSLKPASGLVGTPAVGTLQWSDTPGPGRFRGGRRRIRNATISIERHTGSMGSEYTTLRMPPAEAVLLARLDRNIIARRVFIDPENGLIGLMSPSSDHEIHARATDQLMNAIADRVGLGAVGLGASRWYGPGGPEERKETERQMQAFARARNL